jgi:hypothetical protein
MNFRIRIDPDARLGEVTCFDRLTADDMIEATRRLTDDRLWQSGYGELWDGSAVTDLRIAPSDFGRLHEIDRCVASVVGATALVVPSFAARKLAEAYLKLFPPGRPARVFAEPDEARAWLETVGCALCGPTNL